MGHDDLPGHERRRRQHATDDTGRPRNQEGSFIYTIICLKSVAVFKLQVAILARSPWEMSQTDRIV